MAPGVSSTVEDYLKSLLLQQQRAAANGQNPGGMISTGQLAEAVGVTAGTATTMIKTLAESGLIDYEPRVGVRLTHEGERLAMNVLRRHRLIELLLVEVLKLDWSEVGEEAEVLEHAVSPRVLEKIDDLLGHPTIDPHGDPIPTASGKLNGTPSYPLSEADAGQTVTIVRVEDQDAEFLRFAEQHGLLPNASVTLLEKSVPADAITVEVNGQREVLGFTAAQRVLVWEQ